MGCYSCGHPMVTIQQGEADSASWEVGAFISVCQDTGKMESIQGMGISVLIYCVYSRPFFQCLWLLIFLHLIFYYHVFYDISRYLLNQKGELCFVC